MTKITGPAAALEGQAMRATVRRLVALVVVAACSGEHRTPLTSADSGSRVLRLAPTDSSVALNDNAAAPRRPDERGIGNLAASRSLPPGTSIPAIMRETIHSRHQLPGRGVSAGEVEKVGVGTVAGAVLGRLLGGNTKGAVIGGAVGAAGGTAVAVQTASRDVVVPAGTPLTIALTGPLAVAGS